MLTDFIREYENDIFECHVKEIKSHIQLMIANGGRRLADTEYGRHFMDCIYSTNSDNLVLDVCECALFQMRGRRIYDLIRKYKSLLFADERKRFLRSGNASCY